MRHDKGVLDTSAVLRLHELEPDDLPIDAALTTVTLAELSVGRRALREFADVLSSRGAGAPEPDRADQEAISLR